MILFATSFHFSKFKLGSGFIFEPSRFTQLILCQIFLSSSALDMHLFRLDFKAKVKPLKGVMQILRIERNDVDFNKCDLKELRNVRRSGKKYLICHPSHTLRLYFARGGGLRIVMSQQYSGKRLGTQRRRIFCCHRGRGFESHDCP